MRPSARFAALLSLALATPAYADPIQPGELLVSTPACGFNGCGDFNEAMFRVNPQTGVQTLFSKDGLFGGVTDILVTPDHRILCASQGSPGGGPGRVLQVDPSTGTQTVFASGGLLFHPASIALGANGALLVADYGHNSGDAKVIRLDPITAAQTLVVGGLKEPTDAAELSNGDILIADYSDDDPGVFLWHHDSGLITKVTHDPVWVTSILLSSQGSIYLTQVDQFEQLDLTSGSVTGISPSYELWKMAEESSGSVVMVGGTLSNVYRVDPVSGTTTIVSHLGNLFYPLAIAVWPDAPVKTLGVSWGKLKALYR